jgi:sialate O-acetylesterase
VTPTFLALLLSGVLAPAAAAEVRLAGIFGDGMVLQRDLPLPIWGTAAPGEEVTVLLGPRRARAKADAEGRWRALLDPLPAGTGLTLAVEGKGRSTIRDVGVGEVWICSGQSNMEWPVSRSAGADEETARAEDADLRLLVVPHRVAGEPREGSEGLWTSASPKTVPSFSAVALAFGREIRSALGVPVGLIQATWGGTPAEAWTSRGGLEGEGALRPMLERWERTLAEFPEAKKRFDEETALWREASAKARSEGRPEPGAPSPPAGPDHPHRPSGLWNGMIAPLLPFAIRGAIWYQGESNASRAEEYAVLFPALIRDWRRAWGRGDFPFLFVQLANFRPGGAPDGRTWAELRDAQRRTLSLPNTAMAVTIDIGDPADIHPRNKGEVGRRLALAAKARVHGLGGVDSGPFYRSMSVEGDSARLRFDGVGGGLRARGALAGFEIAGEDRRFVPGEARIDGEDVLVRSPEVARPLAVRYAWADDPPVSLFNAEGLPASPFCTDGGSVGAAGAR